MPETEYEYSSKIKQQPRQRMRKARASRSIISLLIMLLSVAAVVLILGKGLYTRIELTKQNDVNIELRDELDRYEDENRRLSIRCESAMSLAELEEYAKNELGMQKPSKIQKIEIDTEMQDKAIILNETGAEGIADKIGDLISIISDALL